MIVSPRSGLGNVVVPSIHGRTIHGFVEAILCALPNWDDPRILQVVGWHFKCYYVGSWNQVQPTDSEHIPYDQQKLTNFQ